MRLAPSAVALTLLVLIMSTLDASGIGTPDDGSSTDAAAEAVVVETSGRLAFQRVLRFAEENGIAVKSSFENSWIVSLRSDGLGPGTLSTLSEIQGVVTVEPERMARTLYTPNDPRLSLQWGLDTINAYEAWDITRGNHSVVVAVLDTGIDWNHPDLEPNMWTDADGYHGYNFIDNNRMPMDDNVNSYDENGIWIPGTYTYHGTHVAGVVGAAIDNNEGIAGVAQIRLMAVKVMNESGEGTDSTVASGIRWAVDPDGDGDTSDGAHIITMSLGVDGASSVLTNAVNFASAHGVVMVAASGNSGSSVVSYPAAYPNVIAVGAVDSGERRATFSDFGDNLDVMAPGVQIFSTQLGGSYQYLSGTSTAAPHVAGVAALMLTVNPALTPVEIGGILNSTAKDISRAGYDTSTGWGIVDAFAAVEQISDPTVTIIEYPDFVEPNATFSIVWMVSGGDPGIIQSTYLRWGTFPAFLDQNSTQFSGETWATFTVDDIPSLPWNGTIYLKAYATVDGMLYESVLLEVPVHEAPPDGILSQFIKEVSDFIYNDLGLINFLIILGLLIIVPVIVIAARPKRRRTTVYYHNPEVSSYQSLTPIQYTPPPPPPPRFEAYVDIVGREVLPATVKVYEGTKVVWVNRVWAPPPGVAIMSGTVDATGEHPDGTFQSGLLIAPGDYWSVTFHKPGVYEYYVTGIWKSGRILVESTATQGG
jgi:subtilisin family serine protease